jgi:hypothetical protein
MPSGGRIVDLCATIVPRSLSALAKFIKFADLPGVNGHVQRMVAVAELHTPAIHRYRGDTGLAASLAV